MACLQTHGGEELVAIAIINDHTSTKYRYDAMQMKVGTAPHLRSILKPAVLGKM